MTRALPTLLMLSTLGCGGASSPVIKVWSGAIMLVANGTFANSGADTGGEMLSFKCLLNGKSGVEIQESYMLDSTFADQCSHKGSIQGDLPLTGEAAAVACSAALDPNSGNWSVALQPVDGLKGLFDLNCPAPLGDSMKMDSFAAEDPWLLSDVNWSAKGTTSTGSGSLNGTVNLTPMLGMGSISLTWSVSPQQ